MRHDFLDRFSRLESPVHCLPTAGKAAAALIVVTATALLPLTRTWFFVALPLLLALATAWSRIPPGFVLRRLLLLEPFVAGVAVLSLLQPGGGRVALAIVVKSSLCLATMILLTNTTPA